MSTDMDPVRDYSVSGLKASLFLAVALMMGTVAAVPIEDRLMARGYRHGRTGNGTVDTVVIHFSSNVGNDRQNPYDLSKVLKVFADNNVSAHYIIDRGGKIYRLVKESDTAFHAGLGSWAGRTNEMNGHSIGIELLGIGTFDELHAIIGISRKNYDEIKPENLGFTAAQYTALKALLDDILARQPAIKKDRQHIIGHQDYAPRRKFDPGKLFDWKKIGL